MTQTHLTQRHGYTISFRRTEADRRPARVVRMPNDGPDPDRFYLAAARRAQIESREIKHPPKAQCRDAILVELLKGGQTARVLSEALGFGLAVTSDVTAWAAKDGLVIKQAPSRGQEAVISLTPAGRAWVAESIAA